MTSLKNVLMRQAALPANFEMALPNGLPKVSQLMSQFASALPIDVPLPDVPAAEALAAPQIPGIPGFQSLIMGIEDALPEGLPSVAGGLSQITTGGYRPVSTKEEKPKQLYRIMGGGYRGVS